MGNRSALVVVRAFTLAGLLLTLPAQAFAEAPSQTHQRNPVSILFHSDPNPLKSGENKFEVMVKDGDKAVRDAEVTLTLALSRPQERDERAAKPVVLLKHYGDGIYRGQGQVTASGRWTATIHVNRAGQEIGSRTLTLEAK